MTIQNTIEQKLQTALHPTHLQVRNESHMHSGPATESHFKVTLVSEELEGLSAVKRHQRVYGILGEELQGPVHALALHLHTPAEWAEKQQQVPDSPNCRGGSQ